MFLVLSWLQAGDDSGAKATAELLWHQYSVSNWKPALTGVTLGLIHVCQSMNWIWGVIWDS